MKLLTLAMVLVLAWGAMAMANDSADVYAEVQILPTANIWAVAGADVSFLTEPRDPDAERIGIEGQRGIYSNNFQRVWDHLAANLPNDGDPYDRNEFGGQDVTSDNTARFMVETNAPVTITPDVNWDTWMKFGPDEEVVPTLFYVSPRDENGDWYRPLENHLAGEEKGIDDNIVSVFGNVEGFEDGSWTQGYRYCTDQEYAIYFGFILDKLTQIEAGDYNAVITLTVGFDG